jgi:hypothetical protein
MEGKLAETPTGKSTRLPFPFQPNHSAVLSGGQQMPAKGWKNAPRAFHEA